MIVIGKISGVFGVRGQVRVNSFTDPGQNILTYNPWYLGQQDDWKKYELESGQPHGRGIIARLRGYTDRDSAMKLVGCNVAVHRQQLPPTPAGEYYWSDLEGLTVVTADGVVLGQVSYLFETGSNDVMVVRGDRQHLVPFIRQQVVRQVDMDAGQILVDWDPEF